MNAKYTNPRISFDGKYWYISVGTERENNALELREVLLGIYLGVKDLTTCSTGKVYKNINKKKLLKN